MTRTADGTERPRMPGLMLHKAAGYDLLLWLATGGRERTFREKMLQFACLEPGETVLDVGCGTGTLALLAKRQVGPAGKVYGIDASPEMIARAQKKARKAGADVCFKEAFAQALPFPDARFDVAVTTVMLHHLPKKSRADLAAEIRRVLKPGGRVLAIDFGAKGGERKSFVDPIHRRHGHVDFQDLIALFRDKGLNIAEGGDVGMRELQYVLATVPNGS